MKKAVLFVIVCIFSIHSSFSQVLPDSLKQLLIKAGTDSSYFKKVNQTVIKLIANADTARRDLFIQESLKIAETQAHDIEFLEFVSRNFEKSGDYFHALDYYSSEMKLAEKRNNKSKQAFI